ncbi:DUF5359 family protein [Fictibacillus iocasae]|uniref:DUF5359 family protein n=1 Tax=Fictibacillus iocasae TaxID=2715437 RepID=A0ABW2NR03_9BACL
MKTIDHMLVQLAAVHLILLLLAQCLNQSEEFRRLTSKSVQYEGVIKEAVPETLETIDRK